jgi:hypothetical protein
MFRGTKKNRESGSISAGKIRSPANLTIIPDASMGGVGVNTAGKIKNPSFNHHPCCYYGWRGGKYRTLISAVS